MGKCFLWLWGGILLGLSFAVSAQSGPRASVGYCLAGALEWVLIGGMLTVAAVFGYAVYTLCEQRKRHQ